MSSPDPHSFSHPNGRAQPPPPPLPPSVVLSRGGKDRSLRSSYKGDRIQRSLESMTTRHTQEDVQQLIFRYLQQSGYLRSAMSFAYECMSTVGQPQQPHRRGWSPRHPLQSSANATDYQRLLHAAGSTFSQLMQHQQQEQQLAEGAPAATSENNNDTANTDSLLKENWDRIIGATGAEEDAAAADSIASAYFTHRQNHGAPTGALFGASFPPAGMEAFPTSVAAMTHPKHLSRRQAHRGSSPFGTILLILVVYALLRLGSMK